VQATHSFLTQSWQAQVAHINVGKVAVLMGGRSGERDISLLSGQGVLAALQSKGINAHAFDPAQRALDELKRDQFDSCFVALHGRYGEDGTVQGALELLGLPYTGSGVLASSVAMDKIMTKRIWQTEGIPTPAWRMVHSAQELAAAFADLGAPMIVKPAREGSSLGLSKVLDASQCQAAYQQAAQCDSMVLCEQFIAGDEVTCPILGTADAALSLPIIRIMAPDGNYDYQNKYFKNDTQYLVPSGLPASEEAQIAQWVLKAYRTLGCRGWGRIDVMIDQRTRQPYLLEVNTAPGMTSHSLVPMSAKAAGLDYPDLCLGLLQHAVHAHQLTTQGQATA
jgi:D-alanine-D-alanine ligase